ncbi:MAG: HEAT repeat domain-containing protein [Thermodesulfobacteriota bacterium]|nr:HEAT repeat domain-containing protein [Thermodesulfobacteriota bacterium]
MTRSDKKYAGYSPGPFIYNFKREIAVKAQKAFLEYGREALTRGDLLQARSDFDIALSMFPKSNDASQEAERLRCILAAIGVPKSFKESQTALVGHYAVKCKELVNRQEYAEAIKYIVRSLAIDPYLSSEYFSFLSGKCDEQNTPFCKKRSKIYEELLGRMLARWSESKKQLLERLSYQLAEESETLFSMEVFSNIVGDILQSGQVPVQLAELTPADLIIELTEDLGLMKKVDDYHQRYAFFHPFLRDYLVASFMRKMVQNNIKGGMRVVKEHIWDHDWCESLTLLSGLMDNPMTLIQTIDNEKDDIFCSLLVLEGRCLAESQHTSDPLALQVIGDMLRLWDAYPTLDYINATIISLGKVHLAVVESLSELLLKQGNADFRVHVSMSGTRHSEESIEAGISRRLKEVRLCAAETLGRIERPEAVETLIACLKDVDREVREHVSRVLGRSRAPEAIETIINGLRYSDLNTIILTAWALGEIGAPHAVAPLVQLLKDADSGVRSSAAEALGKIGDSKAIKPLVDVIEGGNVSVRRSAAWALGKIGAPHAVAPLVQLLKDADSEVRSSAAEALGKIGDSKAIKPLALTLQRDETSVKHSAARALGEIGALGVSSLIEALGKKNSKVRNGAAWALGEIGAPHAVAPLVQLLKDADSGVRSSAAEALGKIGDSKAIKLLVDVIGGGNVSVRRSAAWALGEIEDPHAVAPLVQLLKDVDSGVRSSAAEALGKIGDSKAIKPLVDVIGGGNVSVRRSAAWALGEIGAPHAVAPLVQLLKDTDSGVRSSAAEALGRIGDSKAIKPLALTLQRDETSVKHSAARALGEIGDPQTVEPLIEAIIDNDIVRRTAVESLSKVGTLKVLEELITQPTIDIFSSELLFLTRTLALRYSKTLSSPIYVELVSEYKPLCMFPSVINFRWRPKGHGVWDTNGPEKNKTDPKTMFRKPH